MGERAVMYQDNDEDRYLRKKQRENKRQLDRERDKKRQQDRAKNRWREDRRKFEDDE